MMPSDENYAIRTSIMSGSIARCNDTVISDVCNGMCRECKMGVKVSNNDEIVRTCPMCGARSYGWVDSFSQYGRGCAYVRYRCGTVVNICMQCYNTVTYSEHIATSIYIGEHCIQEDDVI